MEDAAKRLSCPGYLEFEFEFERGERFE